jgi:hypothetical protein
MTIDKIYKKEEISIRSYNVCKSNQLYCVEDLKRYYYKNKSFEKLRNCGEKSNKELIEICNKYQGEFLDNLQNEIEKRNPLKNIILNLTRIHREVINSFIFVNTNSLSARSKNAISLYLKGNLKIKNFTENIFLSNDFNITYIQNVGTKSITELEVYLEIIRDFIIEVSQSDDKKYIISLKNSFLIQRTFSILKIPTEILESESIFSLTNFLLKENAFFDKTRAIIVKKTTRINFNQKELTLDEIAEEVGLSRERIRQIKKDCLDELFQKLSFIQNFNDDLFQKYGIDITSNYIDINSNIVDKINNSNNINLSKEFITYILSSYLNKDFKIIGNYEDVLQSKQKSTNNRHNWNNFYLVKKEIVSKVDFHALVNDISSRLSDKVDESYFFHFKSYLSRFLIDNNIEILDLVFSIGEKIVNDEFGLYLDLDENLIFKRNTNKQVYEYAFEALEHLAKPSKVKEIFEKVIELYPSYNTEEARIRVSMKRKNGFLPIGRKSVFGLKKWENELDDFKGGTIRNIAEEYLSNFSTPKHISDITEYVLKYRPKSNQYSISQNLKLDESGLYVFFKGSQVGLSSKKYDENSLKITKSNNRRRNTWEESFEMLRTLTEIEKRLPYSTGVPENEIKLYNWLNIQRGKLIKGKLDENKATILNNLLQKYPSRHGKRKLNSDRKYKELILFVSTNHRLPSANKKGEETLYQFIYKQRKLFDTDKLDKEEEVKFIEVAKLIQNIKHENKRN